MESMKPVLEPQLRATCHFSSIQDVVFPRNYARVFVTCANNDIRVWHAAESRELLRIQVPNLMCNCVTMSPDGGLILSGWSDGKVRAFYPESGALKFVINDAHADGVSAVACTNDCTRVVTGGVDGRVRMWGIRNQDMIASLKEHKATVTSIIVRDGDEERVMQVKMVHAWFGICVDTQEIKQCLHQHYSEELFIILMKVKC